jgi:hypothetical protein
VKIVVTYNEKHAHAIQVQDLAPSPLGLDIPKAINVIDEEQDEFHKSEKEKAIDCTKIPNPPTFYQM